MFLVFHQNFRIARKRDFARMYFSKPQENVIQTISKFSQLGSLTLQIILLISILCQKIFCSQKASFP